MTDNLPATVQATEITTVDTDSWTHVVGDVAKLSAHIADTDFVPKGLRGSAPAVAAAILYGREVGLPPMSALNMTHVVEGKPGLSAEGMRALVLASGHEIEVVEASGGQVVMRGRRRGSDTWTTVAWNLDMARAAGVAGKQVWQRYPRAMLLARATTELCRMIFPDVIHGFRSVEELEDLAGEPGSDAPASRTGGTSKVTRKRAAGRAPRTSTPPPAEAAQRPSLPAGPPLPGEDGYDNLAPGKAPEKGTQTPEGGASGEDDGPEPSSGEDTTDAPSSGPDAPGSAEEADPAGGHGPEVDPADQGASSGGESEEGGRVDGDAADPGSPSSDQDEPVDKRPPAGKVSRAQQRMAMSMFGKLGIADDREERLLVTSSIVGREVPSTNDLTKAEATTLIDTLAKVKDRDGLNRLLDTIDEANAAKARAEGGDDS